MPGTWQELHERWLAHIIIWKGPNLPIYCSLASDAKFRALFFFKIRHGKMGGKKLIKTGLSSKQTGLASCMGNTFSLILCCCHLDILNNVWRRDAAFSFCPGPTKVAVPTSNFLWMLKAPGLLPPLFMPLPFSHHQLPQTQPFFLSNILMKKFKHTAMLKEF